MKIIICNNNKIIITKETNTMCNIYATLNIYIHHYVHILSCHCLLTDWFYSTPIYCMSTAWSQSAVPNMRINLLPICIHPPQVYPYWISHGATQVPLCASYTLGWRLSRRGRVCCTGSCSCDGVFTVGSSCPSSVSCDDVGADLSGMFELTGGVIVGSTLCISGTECWSMCGNLSSGGTW